MENVHDYPRPPAVEPCARRVRVVHAGATVADSSAALRVLETTHPPGIYVPRTDVVAEVAPSDARQTLCEFKGLATYWDVAGVRAAAWSYEDPSPGYESLRGHLSFYPSRMDECRLDEERVRAQEGGFYGGWISDDVEGPFKGAPGTAGW